MGFESAELTIIIVYINLPICLFALIVLSTSLRGIELKRASDASWSTLIQRFDFGGL